MRFNSSLKQSVVLSLTILSLICVISLASAYFTTFGMSAVYDEKQQSVVASGDEKQENPKESHCDSETMKCPTPAATLRTRYLASMVLSGVGDAMGYHRGRWEFNKNGVAIHDELKKRYNGLQELNLTGSQWIVSDDTVMHIATADALVKFGTGKNKEKLYKILSEKYIECMNDMDGRAPGPTCIQGVSEMETKNSYKIPFNSRGGGCGAAMRAMCIGLRYPKEDQLDDLIAVSIESGRMTHNHPTGYLGGLASALFTAYAIQEKPINSWGKGLMDVLEKAQKYIKTAKRDVKENLETWSYFETQWRDYLRKRNISDGNSAPEFPPDYDVRARDDFYREVSFSGWGGSSGHDAPMIAYDALLGSEGLEDMWLELCRRGMLHGGDNDSTGAIAGAWFGALYGYRGVPEKHYEHLEYREKLENLGTSIYDLSQPKVANPPHKSTAL